MSGILRFGRRCTKNRRTILTGCVEIESFLRLSPEVNSFALSFCRIDCCCCYSLCSLSGTLPAKETINIGICFALPTPAMICLSVPLRVTQMFMYISRIIYYRADSQRIRSAVTPRLHTGWWGHPVATAECDCVLHYTALNRAACSNFIRDDKFIYSRHFPAGISLINQ